jgi:3-dehydroquinate synthase
MSRLLVLAGPPGAGKSTVGPLCAARLGWQFMDTDAELARRAGLPVAELIARHGEAQFRAHEAALCRELADKAELVLATGGGTLLHEPTRALLLQRGVGVCLTAAAPELARRLGPAAAHTRPLLRTVAPASLDSLSQRLDELLRERAATYAALPYHLDTTGATPESLAALACGLATAQSERLVVAHPRGRYDLVLGTGLLDYVGPALAGRGYRGPLALISDTHVGPLYAARVEASLAAAGLRCLVELIPAGEAHKNLQTLERLYAALAAGGVERGGAVLALGGGVVGDLAGLLAATYLRGIGFVQLPTSLLAMADSSIGGKVGIDLPAGKNLVGAFKHPDLVVMDLGCLATLPPAELRAGLGEVVKAALIAGGDAYARLQGLAAQTPAAPPETAIGTTQPPLEAPPALPPLAALLAPLRDALQLKRTLVEEDPEEHGRRIFLNLGHTFAHGLEAWSAYRLRHGDAVSLGLVCAAELSARLGLCPAELPGELGRLLYRLGLPTTLPAALDSQGQKSAASPAATAATTDDKARLDAEAVQTIWAFMQRDKKRHARRIRFVLIRAPGEILTCDFVEDGLAQAALRALLPHPPGRAEDKLQDKLTRGSQAGPGHAPTDG